MFKANNTDIKTNQNHAGWTFPYLKIKSLEYILICSSSVNVREKQLFL